jgi:hypothetical protein
MKIEKGEDSAFISEAADWLTLFGGPVKFKKFDESPALVTRNTSSVSSASSSSSEDEEDLHEVPPLCLCLLIPHQTPHPSVPPLFHQDQVILNT